MKRERKGKEMTAAITASFAMLLLIFAILLTSFQLAVYGDSDYRFYEKEYQKYHVTDALGMELEDVMIVTDYMMDYLIGREEELSVVTEVDGRTQDFFNDQDRFHMGEVKDLFLGGLRLRNICADFIPKFLRLYSKAFFFLHIHSSYFAHTFSSIPGFCCWLSYAAAHKADGSTHHCVISLYHISAQYKIIFLFSCNLNIF